MNTIDTILGQIAQQHLGLETLDTRHRDSLDFYDLAVWNLRAALAAAYRAGQQNQPNQRVHFIDQRGRRRSGQLQGWRDGKAVVLLASQCTELVAPADLIQE
ncbi:DUF6900 domain-containing protein [Chitinilyticum aquatile]|uniref:DUF6900 domain-containing protein n=1 Tax=Chitinilyticum aquatile TaxID=362520 RepID=UPI0012DDD9CB|nr:hypothetical protein [Chitinilyticum aquatile]